MQSSWTESLSLKYSNATSNVTKLEAMGATVLHGVDVKEMNLHSVLEPRLFDRIVFNFPHAGFRGREDEEGTIRYEYLYSCVMFGNLSILCLNLLILTSHSILLCMQVAPGAGEELLCHRAAHAPASRRDPRHPQDQASVLDVGYRAASIRVLARYGRASCLSDTRLPWL